MYDGCSVLWLRRRSQLEVKRQKKLRKRFIETSVRTLEDIVHSRTERQRNCHTRNTSTNRQQVLVEKLGYLIFNYRDQWSNYTITIEP